LKATGIGWPVKIYRPQIQNHKSQQQEKKRVVSDPHENIPEDYKKVAKGLEQQFAQYMIEQMQKTIGKEDDSTAMNYYKELTQKEQAKMMTESKSGMGIQDLILDEIYPKKFRNPEAVEAYNQAKQQNGMRKKKIEMAGPVQEKRNEQN
jgi:Rod binding domain-containing protein